MACIINQSRYVVRVKRRPDPIMFVTEKSGAKLNWPAPADHFAYTIFCPVSDPVLGRIDILRLSGSLLFRCALRSDSSLARTGELRVFWIWRAPTNPKCDATDRQRLTSTDCLRSLNQIS